MGIDSRAHDLHGEVKRGCNQGSCLDEEIVGLAGVSAFNVACEQEHLCRSDKAGTVIAFIEV
jgi:predicted metalloprotease